MEKVEITTADGATGDLENNIAVFDNDWLGDLNYSWSVFGFHVIVVLSKYSLTDFDAVLALPTQRLHFLGRVTVFATVLTRVGDILNRGSRAIANQLLNLVCCLRQCHVCGME